MAGLTSLPEVLDLVGDLVMGLVIIQREKDSGAILKMMWTI